MARLIPLLPPLFALSLALAGPLAAQEPPAPLPPAPLPPGLRAAEVLDGWRSPEGDLVAALKISLEPGWKTYWRVPGDAGVPPVFDFSGSDNLADLEVVWPAPEVFEVNGMRAVGYREEMVLPLVLTPRDPSRPVDLAARLDLGVCHEICVPVQLSLGARLSGAGGPDDEIAAALGAEPAPRPGLARCTLEPIRDGVRVHAAITLPQAADEVALFELRSRPMWVSDSVMQRQGGELLAAAEFVPDTGRPFDLDRNDLRITVLSAAGAIEIDGCAEAH